MPRSKSGVATRLNRRATLSVLTVFISLVMAGCSFSCSIGSGPTAISATELENRVEASYVEQTEIDLKSISCAESRAEVGAEISCEATNATDVDLLIEGAVTAVNEDDDKVDFEWEVASAKVPGAHYAAAAKRVLEERTGNLLSAVDCPERVELEPEGEFRCTLTAPDGTELGATVTMADSEGGFDIKVDE